MDIAALPAIPFERRLDLPRRPAVYIVTGASDDVLYVGQARSLRDRWRSHHLLADLAVQSGVRIAWIERPDQDERLILEDDLIRTYRPILNAHRIYYEATIHPRRIQSPVMGEDRLFTLAEVARDTGYTQRRLRQLAEAGTLPATKYGKTYLVKESALDSFKATHQPATGRPRGSKNRPKTISYQQKDCRLIAESRATYPTPPAGQP